MMFNKRIVATGLPVLLNKPGMEEV